MVRIKCAIDLYCLFSFHYFPYHHCLIIYNSLYRYSACSDCPDDQRAVNPEAEDKPWHSDPYSRDNYYFPYFSRTSRGFGRDYPAWMGISGYEKHYLFRTGDECCSKYFPTVSNCPYENTIQNDYFWLSYVIFVCNIDLSYI